MSHVTSVVVEDPSIMRYLPILELVNVKTPEGDFRNYQRVAGDIPAWDIECPFCDGLLQHYGKVISIGDTCQRRHAQVIGFHDLRNPKHLTE